MTNQIAVEMESGQRALAKAELILIRHGETDSPGRLNGRTDVGLATRPAPVTFQPGAVWVSPARRARDTAAGLFPEATVHEDARLWEQDFGVWDGRDVSELPDMGKQTLGELACFAYEDGESFSDMFARVRPALEEATRVALANEQAVVVVAHAGTARAALALAMGSEAGALAFQIAHLRAIRLRCYSGGMAVTAVNERLV